MWWSRNGQSSVGTVGSLREVDEQRGVLRVAEIGSVEVPRGEHPVCLCVPHRESSQRLHAACSVDVCTLKTRLNAVRQWRHLIYSPNEENHLCSISKGQCLGTKIECSYSRQVPQLCTPDALAYNRDTNRIAAWLPLPRRRRSSACTARTPAKNPLRSSFRLCASWLNQGSRGCSAMG